MLFQLGVLTVKVAPFNIDSVKRSSETSFVAKPVVGRSMPHEYVGEGLTTWRLSGTLFPIKLGGLTELALLHAMRKNATPQFLMRGDGAPLGWVVIKKVTEEDDHLGSNGVAQVKKVTIHLADDTPPRASSLFNLIAGLLA